MTIALLAQVVVAGAGGYPGVAAALAAARPGDTVLVRAGVHQERIVVNRPVTLVGEPGAVLDGGGRGDVLRILAPGTIVARLTVRGSGLSLDADDAAIRIAAADVRIEGVTVRESLHGIYVQDARHVALVADTIVGHPALAEADRGNGIHLHASRHVRMERNVIRAVRDGMYFSYTDSTEAIGNRVTESRYGIHYMYSRVNRFIANHFERNAAGASLMYSWDLAAIGNIFADHRTYRGFGLVLHTTERARLVANRFERNRVGIFMDNALNGTLVHNLVARNGLGIEMIANSTGNTFAGNAFIANGAAVRRQDGRDANRWWLRGAGNYWDGATALDLDGDGVRDRPHREGSAFGHLAAGRPALRLWQGSAAMSVLDAAERALPVFRVPSVTDSAPLVQVPRAVPVGAAHEDPRRNRHVALLGVAAIAVGGLALVGAARRS